jgi:hypothetical protein
MLWEVRKLGLAVSRLEMSMNAEAGSLVSVFRE